VSVDALGYPLRFRLTGGERHDITQAHDLLADFVCEYVIADRSYDAQDFIQNIVSGGATPVIPPRSNRRQPRDYDEHIYKERHLAECFMNKIKHFRRVFSRFDKLDTRFLGFLFFVAVLIWLR
jgi:transposase